MSDAEYRPAFSYESGVVSARLAHGERALLRDIRFSLPAGAQMALIGETGSGKTMLALSIFGLLPENVRMQGGSVCLDGQALCGAKALARLRGTKLVYIPQSGSEALNPTRTVGRQLCDSLRRLSVKGAQLRTLAMEKLCLAGFDAPETLLDKYPFQLSGGMAQRVTIALAACSEARLLIADEPTNGLDEAGRERFFSLLDTLFPQAVKLIITHDMSVAAMCGSALVLCGGRMLEYGPSETLLTQPRHPYTRALLAAQLQNGMQPAPVLRDGASACPFYSKCPRADALCQTQPLHRRTDGNTEWWCAHA